MTQRSSGGTSAPAATGDGRIVLVGAPLGNATDASARLSRELAGADVIAAEDTRRLHRLARDLGLTLAGRIVSYFEGNEERRTPELIEAARSGARVVLVTDGGMPGISDPGFRLVRAAIDAGVPITAAPGPSAATTALVLSGLATDRFCFEGFLPRRPGERRGRLEALATEERTLVFFEAPHRLVEMLADAASIFGADRAAAVCRELTKTYEEVRRDSLSELAAWARAGEVRGEITVVVAGAVRVTPPPPAPERLAAEVRAEEVRLTGDGSAGAGAAGAGPAEVGAAEPAERPVPQGAGAARKRAIAEVARRYGLPKRDVYDAVVRHRSARGSRP